MISFNRISLIKAEIFPLLALPSFFVAVLLFLFLSLSTQSLGFAVPVVAASPEVEITVPASYSTLPLALTVPVIVSPTVMAVVPVSPEVPVSPVVSVPAVIKPLEARLIIPKIEVNAVVKSLGDTALGAMEVPNNRFDVSWYNRGIIPGAPGSAVIGGHNYWNGTGVFANLDQLATGDIFSYINEQGGSTSFVVREKRTYDPADDATDIFQSSDGVHLNLITCSGVWDTAANSYSIRLVVFADAI